MNEDNRAADDVATIHTRIQELRRPKPRRNGSPLSHCGHCPKEPEEACNVNCRDEAVQQGWFIPDDTW